MLRETRSFQHLLSPPSLLLSSLADNRHCAAAACLHLPTLLWHSQAHRFWERTWKGTWKGTSQRTCSRALQKSWLRSCKNFYLNIYTTWQRKLMHLMLLKFQSRFYQISSYDKAYKKSWASCGWEKVSRKKSLGTCGKKALKTAKSRCWGKKGARKPKWRSQRLFASCRPGCLRSGCLLSEGGDYGYPPTNPSNWERAWVPAPIIKAKAKAKPQSSVNGLKFFHIIYIQPCPTTSWQNLL